MNISHLIFDQVNDCFNESQIIRKKFSDLKIFAFDYFKFNNKNINKFINIYSKKHHQSLTFNKNLKFSYGFDNVIIRKNFYKYINKNKINNDKKLNVVITFGGSDPMNYTEKVLSHINYIKIPNVAFKILVPLNKKHKFFDFKNKYNLAPFINIYFDPKNLVSIFKNADLVICGGGGTLYEFCFWVNQF